jgi:hypothetical protein
VATAALRQIAAVTAMTNGRPERVMGQQYYFTPTAADNIEP